MNTLSYQPRVRGAAAERWHRLRGADLRSLDPVPRLFKLRIGICPGERRAGCHRRGAAGGVRPPRPGAGRRPIPPAAAEQWFLTAPLALVSEGGRAGCDLVPLPRGPACQAVLPPGNRRCLSLPVQRPFRWRPSTASSCYSGVLQLSICCPLNAFRLLPFHRPSHCLRHYRPFTAPSLSFHCPFTVFYIFSTSLSTLFTAFHRFSLTCSLPFTAPFTALSLSFQAAGRPVGRADNRPVDFRPPPVIPKCQSSLWPFLPRQARVQKLPAPPFALDPAA